MSEQNTIPINSTAGASAKVTSFSGVELNLYGDIDTVLQALKILGHDLVQVTE